MPAHEAATDFPLTAEGLNAYDAIILSDIGSNTLLLHPDVWIHGKPVPNRLKLLRDYVVGGGGLMMIGGYYSFQGINGGARYHRTPIEEVLPVTCHDYDDRIEVPDGFKADVVGNMDHPILDGLGKDWPILLGINEVQVKPGDGVELLARLPADEGGHPLLVTGHLWQGPSHSLDLGHRSPLGASGVCCLARFRQALAAMPRLADRSLKPDQAS